MTLSTSTTLLLRGSIITSAVAVYFGVSCRPARTARLVSEEHRRQDHLPATSQDAEKLLDVEAGLLVGLFMGLPLGVRGWWHGDPSA